MFLLSNIILFSDSHHFLFLDPFIDNDMSSRTIRHSSSAPLFCIQGKTNLDFIRMNSQRHLQK